VNQAHVTFIPAPSAADPSGSTTAPSRIGAVVACALVGGYLATSDTFAEDDRMRFLVCTVISVGAAMLFAMSLRGALKNTLPGWLFYVVFVWGYYGQFFWLLLDENAFLPGSVLARAVRPSVLIEGYQQTTTCFSLAALTVAVVGLVRPKAALPGKPMSPGTATAVSRFGLFAGGALLVGTSALMLALGFGPGRAPNLPFRIAGWIMYSRRALLPAIILATIVYSDTLPKRTYFRLALALFAAATFSDMLLTTSRAGFVKAGFQLLTIFAIQGRLNRRNWSIIGGAAVLTALLFPFLSQVRDNRLSGMDVYSAMNTAQVDEQDVDSGPLARLARPLMGRFSGVTALLPILDVRARQDPEGVLQGFVSNSGVTVYNTQVVYGYRATDFTAVAPSLLGWFYIVGGDTGQMVGIITFVLLVYLLWAGLSAVDLRAKPVMLALTSLQMLTYIGEGTLEDLFLPTSVIVGSVVMLELCLMFVEREAQVYAVAR
jgi:hypothetical protein